MQAEKKSFWYQYENLIGVLLSCVVVFSLHCRFEISGGGFPESNLLNGFNKLYNSFTGPDYVDLVVFLGVFALFRWVIRKDKSFDKAVGALAVLFSVLLVVSVSFKKFNSAGFLFDNSFQVLLSGFCIAGFGILFYLGLRWIFTGLESVTWDTPDRNAGSFWTKQIHFVGFIIILAGWLFWILLNYPGTDCPDGILQLRQFLGETSWGAGHPPLSTFLMGTLFSVGRLLADANFGMFLYCLFQSLVGAWIFSLCMKKLQQLGVPLGWCMAGIAFYAFTPFWGTYAQWFEKDLLYAEIATLQAVYLMEVLKNRACSGKNAILLTVSGLLACLLRNNGIHAIVPALLLLVIWLKGAERKRALAVLLATVVLFEGIINLIYPPLFHASKPSVTEAFSIPFQQTARYVCTYGNEVTDYERQVIDEVLSYSAMQDYDPVISDPIKIHYRGGALSEYFKVWFQMFFKHPGCYVAAFLNQCYGYLAPVSQNIEAWIQIDYYGYAQDLGIHHIFGQEASDFLIQIWSLSMVLPLVKYLCSPGLYTWIVMALAVLLLKNRKYGAVILMIPSFMNVLVCIASPLADAIRYELPTVAVVPLLIGWTCYALQEKE